MLNVEEGSERAVSRGDPENEPVYDMIDDIRGQPNLTMEPHFDYGTRAGFGGSSACSSSTMRPAR